MVSFLLKHIEKPKHCFNVLSPACPPQHTHTGLFAPAPLSVGIRVRCVMANCQSLDSDVLDVTGLVAFIGSSLGQFI